MINAHRRDVAIELPTSKDTLQKRKEKLTAQIQSIINKLSALENEFPFNMASKLADKDWVKDKVETIEKQIEGWEVKCKEYNELLKVLLVSAEAGVN